jgi:lipopolysaccharide export system permease protein
VKVLDRYLIRELLMPIIATALTLVFLVLIADLFDNLDDLLTNKTPILTIVKYYCTMAPYAFSQTIAWATWMGTLFLLVNFGLNNETIAMKAAGLKMSTIIRPVLFVGFLIGILVFLVNDRVVPVTYGIANQLREIYIEKRKTKEDTQVIPNVTFFSEGKQIYYFRKFMPEVPRVDDVIVLWLQEGETNARQKTMAQSGTWDGEKWTFQGVTEYQMDSQGKILGEPRKFPAKTYPDLKVTPRDLTSSSSESTFLSYRELKHSVQKLKENGINVDSEKVELHYRLAAPWQGLVMMLVAVPILAPTRNRKAIAGSILLCIGLVFIYHVMGAISLALGKAGKIFPFLSAWAGNIVFAIGALFMLDRANH